ncbi:endonuclease domain-containing protein [Flavobacterium sp. MXW15]|uniref:Endonuclease domain-containing protein n=1 Tax=Xanthomonas chitinilytica TaxID=2989819 RepID=A0ABT3JWL4_9XANT|nr:endonuclease domain-containing protein [Xanthomonas sp. H13-6]MCW4455630.1 endonuclease domain-containing protein [Flavobacterium sp. MXW15]MCW4472884.1 endonuclease domain-containing protein [Xanthomonas sp. H13-6]
MATIALERARELRARSTDAERKLWDMLRGGQLDGLKFRRQHPIPPYTVDFFCASLGLVIELDGSQHTEESDRARTRYLQSKGLTVLRFWDSEVLTQTEAVAEAILKAAASVSPYPNPSPVGRGA